MNSAVIAAVLGAALLHARAFLNERLTAGRLGACVIIAAGGAFLTS